uniref:Protein arginine N-methyltransferase 1.5 n=1 Tax=Lygus hesperus TaxID=30085 RepID=A0A0A9ZJ79_LYGHE
MESTNQEAIEQLDSRLVSPFKVSSKPCEKERAEVLRCYKKILSTLPQFQTYFSQLEKSQASSATTTKSAAEDNLVRTGEARSMPTEMRLEEAIHLPLFKCALTCQGYEQCVNKIIQSNYEQTANDFMRSSSTKERPEYNKMTDLKT